MKSKIPYSMLLLVFLVFSMACESGKEGSEPLQQDVQLQFRSTFGTEPLLMYQNYDYEAGTRVMFQLFQFYLSDIELVRADNSTYPLTDIALVSFEDIQDESAALQGVSLDFENVPAGTYTGLRLGIGVSPELNKTSPSSYPPGHPLSENYWSAAKGYIHSKIEGLSDTLSGNGLDNPITFHTGSDELYKVVTLPLQFTVDRQLPDPIELAVDLRRVLVDEKGDYLDFRKYYVDHHVRPEVYLFIGANLAESFAAVE